MKIKYLAIIIIAMVMLFLFTDTAFAGDSCVWDDPAAPPQLDEQQAQLWLNASPLGRSYLARLWHIDMEVAKGYGMIYRKGTPRRDKHPELLWYCQPSRYDVGIYTPIPVEYLESPKPEPIGVKYYAPPSLDIVQQTRWGQALPSARMHLARLYGISYEEAMKYGASQE